MYGDGKSEKFQCSRCRKFFMGAPALKNAAGVFCVICKQEILVKAAENRKKKQRVHVPQLRESVIEKVCNWCGGTLTAENSNPASGRVCNACNVMRKRLRGCIDHSGYAARYVQRTEARIAPVREAIKAVPPAGNPGEVGGSATGDSEKIERMEGEMKALRNEVRTLIDALGGA